MEVIFKELLSGMALRVSSALAMLEEGKKYKGQSFQDGKWKTWIPEPAPWEEKPIGGEIPPLMVIEGILALSGPGEELPIRVVEVVE